jgi:hypothetical protein
MAHCQRFGQRNRLVSSTLDVPEHHAVPVRAGFTGKSGDARGEERIVDVPNDHADETTARGAERACHQVRRVAKLGHDLVYALTCGRGDRHVGGGCAEHA